MKPIKLPRCQLAVPPQWSDESTYVFADTAPGDFRASVVITSEQVAPGVRLEDHVTAQLQLLSGQLGRFHLDEPAAPISLNGFDAMKVGFTSTGPSDSGMRQLQVYVRGKRRIYTLTCTDSVDHFADHRQVFFSILNSFMPKA